MGGPNSLQQDAGGSSNSAAVLPQACAQLLGYIAGAKAMYDVQLKVGGLPAANDMQCIGGWAGGCIQDPLLGDCHVSGAPLLALQHRMLFTPFCIC